MGNAISPLFYCGIVGDQFSTVRGYGGGLVCREEGEKCRGIPCFKAD